MKPIVRGNNNKEVDPSLIIIRLFWSNASPIPLRRHLATAESKDCRTLFVSNEYFERTLGYNFQSGGVSLSLSFSLF